jgi:hypothetical protein
MIFNPLKLAAESRSNRQRNTSSPGYSSAHSHKTVTNSPQLRRGNNCRRIYGGDQRLHRDPLPIIDLRQIYHRTILHPHWRQWRTVTISISMITGISEDSKKIG